MRALCALTMVLLVACGSDRPAVVPVAKSDALPSVVVVREAVPDEVQFDAFLEAVQQSTVAAQTTARVEALPFDVGDYVDKGEVVVRFRATEQQARVASAEAAVREAQARLADARSEYVRVKDLHASDVLSGSALDKATAALKSTQAQVEAARAAARAAAEQAEHTVVRAPYAWIVVERHIEVGETATVGKLLITGLSLEHLRAVVEVPQLAIGSLYARRQARVILPGGDSVDATQLRIPPAADPQTHTFRVLATLPEGRHGAPLFPGTLVKVAFVRGERSALLVPPQALVQRSELTAVYVLDNDNRPVLRYVSIGAAGDDGRVPVLSGLSEDERVVLDPVAAAQALQGQS